MNVKGQVSQDFSEGISEAIPANLDRVPWWFRLMCFFLFALGLGFLTTYQRDSYRLMCLFLLGLPTFFVSPFGTKRSFARRCLWPGIVWALLTVQPAQMLLRNGLRLSLSLEALVDYLVQVAVLCFLSACLYWYLEPITKKRLRAG